MAIVGYNTDYARALRLRIAEEIAASAREEARALAAEAELARVRAEAETVRAFYEEREAKLKARIGGEMLRADSAEAVVTSLAEALKNKSWFTDHYFEQWGIAIQERDAARRDLDNALTALEEALAGRA